MTLTILLDLDDTLISNDIDAFLKSYFTTLGEAFSPYVQPPIMMAAMQKAVAAMLKKQFPGGTLEETFDRIFYQEIGIEKKQMGQAVQSYYQTVFPTLRSLTAPRPEAIELVHSAVQRGWSLVVATNPLFPAVAIYQRLEWAGLPVDQVSFKLVTTYENSHFCKPNPSYFTEILARLCWPEGAVVMVGNSLDADIRPAESLGIPTYWLCENCKVEIGFQRHPLSRSGPLAGLSAWLEEIAHADLHPGFDNTAALVATLQSTPAAMSDISQNLPAEWWNRRPAPEEWSFTEILCHLRDIDLEVNYDRVVTILSGSNPFLPAVQTDPWVEERKYVQEDGAKALVDFTEARSRLLNLILNLQTGDWQEPARHAIFGPTTLMEIVDIIATHDRTHVHQAIEALNAARQANGQSASH
jgi:FMN phosphatase YigB (HAD superfamily)